MVCIDSGSHSTWKATDDLVKGACVSAFSVLRGAVATNPYNTLSL